nr:MAG TPA: hypothetical protein [Caudoviricetes sp.]
MQYDFIINKNNFKNHKRLLALMLEKNMAQDNLSGFFLINFNSF